MFLKSIATIDKRHPKLLSPRQLNVDLNAF